MQGLKGLAYALPSVAKRCQNLVSSNWKCSIGSGTRRATKDSDAASDIVYLADRDRFYLYVPKSRTHDMNALRDKHSPLCVSSSRVNQIEEDLFKDLKDLGLCAPRVSLMGDVVPLSREEELSATSFLQKLVEKELKGIQRTSYAVHGILNSSAIGTTTKTNNLLKVLGYRKDAYELYGFNISSCSYNDLWGKECKVDINDMQTFDEDPLAAYSERLIDGINRVKARRSAMLAILQQFLVSGTDPSDVYLLCIDKKGIVVLAEYCIKLSGKDYYQWEEFRLDFEDEKNDAEEFCQLLIHLEDQLVLPFYQGSCDDISKTESGVFVPNQYTQLHRLFDSKALPRHLDWTERVNPVPQVYDQGPHGTCWAMSVTSSIEFRHLIDSGQYTPLSAQQIIDYCPYGTQHPLRALEYVLRNGLAASADYKYVGYRSAGKPFKPVVRIKGISGWSCLESRDWRSMHPIVTQHPIDVINELQSGPAVVNVSAARLAEYNGENDIYECDHLQSPDHAVLCTGYNFTNVCRPSWKLQNSWGVTWGRGGYVDYGDGYRGGRPRSFGDYFSYSFADMCLRPK